MGDTAELETLNYRLTNIEGKLESLEKLLTTDALQQRDISDLQKSVSNFLQAVNAHEARIKALELAPLQTKAEKWTVIVDYIFKAIIALTCTMLLSKVGLSL